MAELRTQSVPALERGLRILGCLAESQNGLTLSQITRHLELPKSTVHTILLTFERSGYIQRDESTSRFRLGPAVFRLASAALPALRVREQAASILRNLMDRTRLTVHMAALDGDELVLIARVNPPGIAAPASWIGKRMDFHCTALGKAILAHLAGEHMERLIRKHGMLRHNDNTISSMRRLVQELESTRRRGYAVDDEEEEIGMRCVGSAVINQSGQPECAISLVGTVDEISNESLATFAELIRTAAAKVSERLSPSSSAMVTEAAISATQH